MSPPPPSESLGPEERRLLLEIAHTSIATGLHRGRPAAVELHGLPPRLLRPGASFVSLHHGGRLRGCIGALEARRPLAEDVAAHAFAAAFQDPRFPPLVAGELEGLEVEVSVLGPLEPLSFTNLEELQAALVPERDGLVIEQDGRRATFLPVVWKQLPAPAAFLEALARKAGLGRLDPRRLRAWRYRAERIV